MDPSNSDPRGTPPPPPMRGAGKRHATHERREQTPSQSPGVYAGRRRRRLKSLAMLPTLLTLGNLICGFAAVYFGLQAMYDVGAAGAGHPSSTEVVALRFRWVEKILPTWLSIGAFAVLVGMIFDGLDGLVARVTRSSTDFGGQLDSLADVVNFGVAPATLMVAYMMRETRDLEGIVMPSPLSENLWGKIVWLSAAVYVAFTAIRLARYNVEHARDDFDHRAFRGLPSPAAAGMMVVLIFLHDQLSDAYRSWIPYAMPAFALLTGGLMVTRLPYRRLQTYFHGRKPFEHVIFAVLFLALFAIHKTAMLFLLMVGYVLSGPLTWGLRAWRLHRETPSSDQERREPSSP